MDTHGAPTPLRSDEKAVGINVYRFYTLSHTFVTNRIEKGYRCKKDVEWYPLPFQCADYIKPICAFGHKNKCNWFQKQSVQNYTKWSTKRKIHYFQWIYAFSRRWVYSAIFLFILQENASSVDYCLGFPMLSACHINFSNVPISASTPYFAIAILFDINRFPETVAEIETSFSLRNSKIGIIIIK